MPSSPELARARLPDVRVSAILLAAGESIRMGRQKALLPWRGATLIEYQLAQLAAIPAVTEIIVVTGDAPGAINDIVAKSPRARTAHNPDYRRGKVSSILTGVRATSPESDAILLLSVDQPRTAAVHEAVIQRQATNGGPITIPAYNGRRGHPVVFARSLFSELMAIDEATQGVRAVIRRHDPDLGVIEIDDASVTWDLNTPEDVEKAGQDPKLPTNDLR